MKGKDTKDKDYFFNYLDYFTKLFIKLTLLAGAIYGWVLILTGDI